MKIVDGYIKFELNDMTIFGKLLEKGNEIKGGICFYKELCGFCKRLLKTNYLDRLIR